MVDKANVVILEDDDNTSDEIRALLDNNGIANCRIARTLSEFDDILKERADVISIDVDINGRRVLQQAARKIADLQPQAAKFVYSVYNDVNTRREATRNGFDAFIPKTPELNYDHYQKCMIVSIDLGITRRIRHCLVANGFLNPTESTLRMEFEDSKGYFVNESDLINLKRVALDYSIMKILEAEKSNSIECLMNSDEPLIEIQRYGWWRKFNHNHYISLPFKQKLAKLLQYVNLQEEFTTSLSIPETLQCSNDIPNRNEILLSILSYILRLSHYQPDIMIHYWKEKNLFKDCITPPPWDNVGLENYLKINNLSGLNDALKWIRRY